jgi:hypothetical protein
MTLLLIAWALIGYIVFFVITEEAEKRNLLSNPFARIGVLALIAYTTIKIIEWLHLY